MYMNRTNHFSLSLSSRITIIILLLKAVYLDYIETFCTVCSDKISQSSSLLFRTYPFATLRFLNSYVCCFTNICFQKSSPCSLARIDSRSAATLRRYATQQRFFHMHILFFRTLTVSLYPSLCVFSYFGRSLV